MDDRKYPIGTKIIYKPNTTSVNSEARKDIGKQGTVIANLGNQVKIHLPTSEKRNKTWQTSWKNIKPILVKNQQLLFSFMEE